MDAVQASQPRQESAGIFAPPVFADVFREHGAQVGRTLRYLGVQGHDLADACQEVFVVVHRRLGGFVGGSIKAWLRQICVHVASNHRRSLRRRRESGADLPEVESSPADEGSPRRLEARHALLQLLDRLSEEERVVLVLHDIEAMTMPEVAEIVGCTTRVAYARHDSARARLRKAIGEDTKASP